jgi:hypothetical protein
MSSITDVFAGLDAAVAAVGELDLVALPLAELVEVLDRLETARRRATAFAYDAAAATSRRSEPRVTGSSPTRCGSVQQRPHGGYTARVDWHHAPP